MLRQYETVLKAAADPTRARILKMLEGGEMCVCQIVAALALAESTVSKHLSLLRAAGLVDERKEGRWVFCRLAESRVNEYAPPLLPLIRRWLANDPTIIADARRVARVRRIPVENLCSLDQKKIFLPRRTSLASTEGGAHA